LDTTLFPDVTCHALHGTHVLATILSNPRRTYPDLNFCRAAASLQAKPMIIGRGHARPVYPRAYAARVWPHPAGPRRAYALGVERPCPRDAMLKNAIQVRGLNVIPFAHHGPVTTKTRDEK